MSDSISDGLPDRLLALAEDEIKGISAALSPANSMDLLAAADEISRLREAIRRLAEQDATLSVCNGNVTVTMDATLTDEERVTVDGVAAFLFGLSDTGVQAGTCQFLRQQAATLRKLLERTS